jgi:hypothetical protein
MCWGNGKSSQQSVASGAERTSGLIPASDPAVLNGFAADTTPQAGQRIKIVIAGD